MLHQTNVRLISKRLPPLRDYVVSEWFLPQGAADYNSRLRYILKTLADCKAECPGETFMLQTRGTEATWHEWNPEGVEHAQPRWYDGIPPVDVAAAHESKHARDFGGIGELMISEDENVHLYVKGDAQVFGDWLVFHTSPFGPYPACSRLKVIDGKVYMQLGFTQWLRLGSCPWAHTSRFFPVGPDGLPQTFSQ